MLGRGVGAGGGAGCIRHASVAAVTSCPLTPRRSGGERPLPRRARSRSGLRHGRPRPAGGRAAGPLGVRLGRRDRHDVAHRSGAPRPSRHPPDPAHADLARAAPRSTTTSRTPRLPPSGSWTGAWARHAGFADVPGARRNKAIYKMMSRRQGPVEATADRAVEAAADLARSSGLGAARDHVLQGQQHRAWHLPSSVRRSSTLGVSHALRSRGSGVPSREYRAIDAWGSGLFAQSMPCTATPWTPFWTPPLC